MRLLIIDDDPQMRRLLVSLLGLYGATQCLTAGDAVEAAAVIGVEPVDGIILDLMMPGMHGGEFLRVLRENPGKRHLPVLVVSGENDMEQIGATIQLGAFDFILKPLRPASVSDRVQRFISHCRGVTRRT